MSIIKLFTISKMKKIKIMLCTYLSCHFHKERGRGFSKKQRKMGEEKIKTTKNKTTWRVENE